MAAAVALLAVSVTAAAVAFTQQPFDAGSLEQKDFELAFGASAFWAAAFAALALFFALVVLERVPKNSLSPEASTATSARVGGVLAGFGLGVGWGVLPALLITPEHRSVLALAAIVGLFVMPIAGALTILWALREEDDDFGDDVHEMAPVTASRTVTPRAPARAPPGAPGAGAPPRTPSRDPGSSRPR